MIVAHYHSSASLSSSQADIDFKNFTVRGLDPALYAPSSWPNRSAFFSTKGDSALQIYFVVLSKHVKKGMLNKFLPADDRDDSELFCEAMNDADPSIRCDLAVNGKEVLDKLSDRTIDKGKSHRVGDLNILKWNG